MTGIRCDEAMKESKMTASKRHGAAHAVGWRCTGNCERCVCGLVKEPSGEWKHVDLETRHRGI